MSARVSKLESGIAVVTDRMPHLETASLGGVVLEGREIAGPGMDRMVVFQNFSLMPWMTVTQNVRLAVRSAYPSWSGAQVDDCVTRWDVSYVIGELISELNASHTYRSGGDVETAPTRGVGYLGCDFALAGNMVVCPGMGVSWACDSAAGLCCKKDRRALARSRLSRTGPCSMWNSR